MSDKMKNLIVRAIVGALFVIIMVAGIMHPHTMVALFAVITGLTIWEFTGLVNQRENINVNRFITTIAGVYFFLAVAAIRTGITSNFVIFVPYLLSIVYLFIGELYLKQEDPINDWAYAMLSQLYIALPFSMLNVLELGRKYRRSHTRYDCCRNHRLFFKHKLPNVTTIYNRLGRIRLHSSCIWHMG